MLGYCKTFKCYVNLFRISKKTFFSQIILKLLTKSLKQKLALFKVCILTWLRHCIWSEDLVTVKLTMVTREQMSGGNSTVGSRVDKKMANEGDKSMS